MLSPADIIELKNSAAQAKGRLHENEEHNHGNVTITADTLEKLLAVHTTADELTDELVNLKADVKVEQVKIQKVFTDMKALLDNTDDDTLLGEIEDSLKDNVAALGDYSDTLDELVK